MQAQDVQRILTINTGSSSLKVSLYEGREKRCRILAAQADRIGMSDSHLRVTDDKNATLLDQPGEFKDHGAALESMLDWLRKNRPDLKLDAVGHRVVQGGMHYHEPQRITPDVIRVLQEMVPIAPDHLPQAIQAIQGVVRAYPDLLQVACFDTTFHRRMPRIAQIYPLPRHFADEGILRYGFHGLSYEYITQKLTSLAPKEVQGRVVIAHLGNGASMAAVRGGVGVDTTMGFTPAGGLMMGTRTGDLDPGVLIYLLNERGLTPETLNELVNQKAGLLGVSETSADMRDLLDREAKDPRAAEAVALFCYQARKCLAAMVAALGGLDTLVFTGGIGEHSAPVRQRISQDFEFLNLRIDPKRNEAHAPIISVEGCPVTVRVVKTDEESVIAQAVSRFLPESAHGNPPQ